MWQRRFYDLVVWNEHKRVHKLRYMHRNPLVRGLSIDGAKPEEYRIVANTTGILSAVWVDEIDAAVSSISSDKLTSYVILSTTKPRDWKHDVSRLSAVLFSCSPVIK